MLAHLPFDRDSSVFTILSSWLINSLIRALDRDSSVFTILSSGDFSLKSCPWIEIVLFLQYSQAKVMPLRGKI